MCENSVALLVEGCDRPCPNHDEGRKQEATHDNALPTKHSAWRTVKRGTQEATTQTSELTKA